MEATLVQDKNDASVYRVEALTDDGGCEVALFHAYPVVSHRQNSDGSAMGNGSGLEPWKAKSTGFARWFAE
jgi:hypothetical protein